MPANTSFLGTWLRHAAVVALIVFLGMCSYLMYRMAMVVYRVEQSVSAISGDVRAVTGTVAQLSRDVNGIRDDIVGLKDRVKDTVPVEEAKRAVDEAVAVGASLKAEAPKLPAASEQEIKELLNGVLAFGGRADVGGDDKSVITLYAELYARYRLKRNTLASTEDFIAQVATESILGKPYALVDKAGKRTPLADWMTERLAQLRGR